MSMLTFICYHVSYLEEAEEDAQFLSTSLLGEYQENLHLSSNHSSYSSHQNEPRS